MITINGRKFIIPPEEKDVGFVRDSEIETREIKITESALFDFNFKLDLETQSKEKGIVDLVKTIEIDHIILTWEVKESELIEKGLLKAQIRAFDNQGVQKWHSTADRFSVNDSINATGAFPSVLPSEFEEMELRVTNIQTDVSTKSAQVAEDAVEVAENTQIVVDNTLIVTTKAAEVAEDTIEVATNTLTAEQKAAQASQALSDLLAMLGTDIATLTGGKLTPSQIPALSINDVFEVANTAEMLLLTAQRGDVALIIADNIVTDSYILAADDVTVLTNWKKLGISYVANAGHALTADEATNATMINGHRQARMTQSQYNNAVIDEETDYSVIPD